MPDADGYNLIGPPKLDPQKEHWSRRYVADGAVIGTFTVLSLIILFFVLEELRLWPSRMDKIFTADDVESDCACALGKYGIVVDLCYHMHSNHSVRGRRFTCDSVKYLIKLGLVKPHKASITHEDLMERTFVTAFSASHFPKGLNLIASVHKYVPYGTVVVYDLGLDVDQVRTIKSLCNVVYRRFEFERYPRRVRLLGEYRWKPIVITDALKHYPVIMYMDSSVQVTSPSISHLYNELHCKASHSASKNSQPRGFLECHKPYILFSYTGHGLYEYLPTNLTALRSEKAPMFEAGIALIARTDSVVQGLLKWYVACALEDDCMAPVQRPMLDCMFTSADRFATYANCHRYDQSALNVLLANANNFDIRRYTSRHHHFFRIKREHLNGNGTEPTLQRCR